MKTEETLQLDQMGRDEIRLGVDQAFPVLAEDNENPLLIVMINFLQF